MQRMNGAERRSSSTERAKRPQWAALEEFARSKIQSRLPEVLEEEVTELLGRGESARRAAVNAPAGYRKRPRQDAALVDDGRYDRSEAASGAGQGAAPREQATAAVRARDRNGRRAFASTLPTRARPR